MAKLFDLESALTPPVKYKFAPMFPFMELLQPLYDAVCVWLAPPLSGSFTISNMRFNFSGYFAFFEMIAKTEKFQKNYESGGQGHPKIDASPL
jgi:hypothetical protein